MKIDFSIINKRESMIARTRALPLFMFATFVGVAASGCQTVPMQRSEIEKLRSVDVVRVTTPPLHNNSFVRALAGQSPSLLTGALAESDSRPLSYSPPQITDFGLMVTEQLTAELRQKAPWWPSMNQVSAPVSKPYVHTTEPWMQVEFFKYEIAPGMGRLFIGLEVSLRRSKGEPLWVSRKLFSGAVHDGAKIETDRLPADTSQLDRELKRAAAWLVFETMSEVERRQK